MASERIRLNFFEVGSKSFTLYVNSTTIADLVNEISKSKVIPKEEIELFFMHERLCISHSLNEYGIRNDSTIELEIKYKSAPIFGRFAGRKIGGGGFSSLRFADLTSADCFKTLGLTTEGPDYRIVRKGLNFSGICKNLSCTAYNKGVHMPKGMFESSGGFCFVSEEIEKLNCPSCNTAIPDKDCTGFGIHDCKADIECKTKANQISNYTIRANKDEFKEVKEMNDNSKIEYKYIKIRLSN